jgi:glycine/D-amino acid oxidase-like deaminating enzyme
MALLEPAGGVIMARRAVQLIADDLQRTGVRLVRARVNAPSESGRLRSVRTTDGTVLAGDAFVFACGAWLPATLPALAERIRATRQVVVYFGAPAGDDRCGSGRLPAWVDFPAGIYGVPDIEGRGVKVGIDQHGPAFDPDTGERTADAESLARARAWLTRRLPVMAGAPVVETRVCQYENSSTGDFLIDAHPAYENVWIAGGGSGHGFKHGPAVGEIAARLVTGGAVTEPRFSWVSKDTAARRAVY